MDVGGCLDPSRSALKSAKFNISLSRMRTARTWLRTRNGLYAEVVRDEDIEPQRGINVADAVPHYVAGDGACDAVERPTYFPEDPTDEASDEDDLEILIDHFGLIDVHGLTMRRDERVVSAIQGVPDPSSVTRQQVPLLRTDPILMPSTFPVLYPYGVGGFNDNSSSGTNCTPDLRDHAVALMLRQDHLFETHPFWLPFSYDLLQRARIGAASYVRMQRQSTSLQYGLVSGLTESELLAVVQAVKAGDQATRNSTADFMLRECRFLTGILVGSRQSRLDSRKDIKAMFAACGEFRRLHGSE